MEDRLVGKNTDFSVKSCAEKVRTLCFNDLLQGDPYYLSSSSGRDRVAREKESERDRGVRDRERKRERESERGVRDGERKRERQSERETERERHARSRLGRM